ncbi:Zinc finger DNA binding protein [Operophtera brumata]|uniref:Zinc finger DNA binding protein n=1 Tax=Operophtera brumata TaxID=104452 RepID=A0A0L7LR99_OPEBR|nr:Zinc finger DNA binding protein [Operophtera brumata]
MLAEQDPATPIHNIDLPIAGKQASLDSASSHAADIVIEVRAQFEDMKAEMRLEFKSFKEEMRSLRSELCAMKTDLAVVKADMISCENKVTELGDRTTDIENFLSGNPIVGNLEQTVKELKMALNTCEQESLLNDVEVTGLPEIKGENLLGLIPLLSTKIGVPFDDREIISIVRSGPNLSQENSASPLRPRKIVVRFNRRITRDKCIQRARQLSRGLTSVELGLEGPPARLYFNERLTRINRQLFAKAREQCRHHQWRYCWTKGGRIYLRKEEGSSVVHVLVEEDIAKNFT